MHISINQNLLPLCTSKTVNRTRWSFDDFYDPYHAPG